MTTNNLSDAAHQVLIPMESEGLLLFGPRNMISAFGFVGANANSYSITVESYVVREILTFKLIAEPEPRPAGQSSANVAYGLTDEGNLR
jgi:hypothetical protein